MVGCTDAAACNYDAAANVNAGCTYVGTGTVSFDVPPMAGSESTLTYAGGTAGNTFVWSVTGGVIAGASSGVDLTSVVVVWDASGVNGAVSVEELMGDCAGSVSANYTLLPNAVEEWERLGWSMYPNPGEHGFWFEGDAVQITCADATGRIVVQQVLTGTRMWVDAAQWAPGIYTIEAFSKDGRAARTWVKTR